MMILLALATACAPSRPHTQQPPPPTLTLESRARGTPSIVQVIGLPLAVRDVWILTGTQAATGPCSGASCVGVASPERWPANVSNGTAEVEILVPDNDTLWIQPVARMNGRWHELPAERILLTFATLQDRDGDGLSDGAEYAIGSDLRHPDTDRGGLEDGVEVDLGRNPLDPADDGQENCSRWNGQFVDWDQDGLYGCCDPDCTGSSSCTEVCGDTRDEDCDGFTGCTDDDCDGSPLCVEDCSTNDDLDGDGLPGCVDDDCLLTCTEDCSVGGDQDGDGLDDCADPDCNLSCVEDCTSGIDDDGDGLVDCQDADCFRTSHCEEQNCTNGIDDDGDGVTDCHDEDCWGSACVGTQVSNLLDGRFTARHSEETYAYTTSFNYATPVLRWTRDTWHGQDLVGTFTNVHGGSNPACVWHIDDLIIRFSSYERSSRWYSGYQLPVRDQVMTGLSIGCGAGLIPLPGALFPDDLGHLTNAGVRGWTQPRVDIVRHFGQFNPVLTSFRSRDPWQPRRANGFRRTFATAWTGVLGWGVPHSVP